MATFRTHRAGEKKTGKKNRSSDLVDLGTFRLFRGSSDQFTWPSVPLVLQGRWRFCEYLGK